MVVHREFSFKKQVDNLEAMANLIKQIVRFREDYFQSTGISAKGFVCPITLDDIREERLCAGHILNDGLGAASSAKVVQFADVDHYYGGTIEPIS
jgi:hypothetical protein